MGKRIVELVSKDNVRKGPHKRVEGKYESDEHILRYMLMNVRATREAVRNPSNTTLSNNY